MYLDEIGDLTDEIIKRLQILNEISLSEVKKTIKEKHFDELVEFRDFLNKFLSKWDLEQEGIARIS